MKIEIKRSLILGENFRISLTKGGFMNFEVKFIPEMGRGLFATQPIMADERVMLCEILVLSQIDTPIVNLTDLKYYTFTYNENQDCLVLGLGEIFNHDDNANVSYRLIEHDGRKMMEFVANRHIEYGQQLFIDYNADTNVNLDSYIQTKSLVG